MDWNQLRHDWQDAAPAAPMMAVDELRRRDRSLWTKVRRRDLLETVAASDVEVGEMALVENGGEVAGQPDGIAVAHAVVAVER